MPALIKLASAQPTDQDLFLSTANPPIWDVFANAQSYATVYTALSDAVRIRDGLAGFPTAASSAHVVIWDTGTGTQYRAPYLSELL